MIYVDDARLAFRRMKMCHLLADSETELHTIAQRIGVARKWHQGDHYDICLKMRAVVIQMGAIEITQRQAAAMRRRQKQTGQLGDPYTAEKWLREFYSRPLPRPVGDVIDQSIDGEREQLQARR